MSSGSAIIGALRVVFGADTAAFEKGVDKVEREAKKIEKRLVKLGKKFTDVGKKMSVGITAPLLAIGVASIKTAASMQELESAFDVTFKGASSSVRKWAEETGDLLGRSTKEIQTSAVAFQSLFGKALDPAQATELTKQFTVLTQDLASFKDLSNEVAQQKLFSGLTGEAEPLKSVGVFINAAATEAKALELGLVKVNGKFTDQQKILARAALIQEQLAEANGDVVKTFDSTTNQLKRSGAAFEELRVVIGTQLLPVITPLIEKVADALTAFSNLPEPIVNTILVVGGLAAALGPVIATVGTVITLFAPLTAGLVAVTGATTAFGAAMTIALGPIGLVVAALGLLYMAYRTLSPAIKDNKEARDELYSLISQNEELGKREKASTLEQARANLEDAKSIRERIKARLEEQEILLKKQIKGFVAVNATPQGKALGKITGTNKRITANIEKTAAAIRASREALEENSSAIEGVEANLAKLGQESVVAGAKTAALRKEQASATKTAKELEKAAKKLAEAHSKTAAGAKQEIEENARLTAALKISREEYNITAEEIRLVEAGYRGTKEQVRALAEELVASRTAMDEVSEARKQSIADEEEAQRALQKTAEDKAAALERAAEDHTRTVESIQKEIENNRLLTEAMQISTREYEIQVEVLRSLESGFNGSALEARALAEELLNTRDALKEITEETEKAEAAQNKLNSSTSSSDNSGFKFAEDEAFLEDFTNTLNSATDTLEAFKDKDFGSVFSGVGESIFAAFGKAGDAIDENGKKALETLQAIGTQFGALLESIKSGDWLDILTEGLGLLGSFFGKSGGGFGAGEGTGFGDILAGFGGLFGGGKAKGGPVAAGVTYLVGEKGPELFTPPGNGNIVPNDKLGGGMVKVVVEANDYFDARVDERAAGVAEPVAQVAATQGIQQYNTAGRRRNKQRLA